MERKNSTAEAEIHRSTLDRIQSRREKATPPALIEEETRSAVESQAQELYELKTQLQHLYDEIKGSLPAHKEWTDESREAHSAPATWQDIKSWLDDGELESFFLASEQEKAPNKPIRQLEQRAKNKVKRVKRAMDWFAEIEEITPVYQLKNITNQQGEAARVIDRAQLQELNDEQKMVRLFHFFKLRELVESRVKRKAYEDDIHLLREDVNFAVEDRRWDDVKEFEEAIQQLRIDLRNEVFDSPESYYDYWGQQLLEAQRVFTEDGRIYETPSIKEKVAEILTKIRDGNPVFIHGETGTGKTELAKYIAREKLGKPALVISGRRGMEITEMTESQDIRPIVQAPPELQRPEILRQVQRIIDSEGYQQYLQDAAAVTERPLEEVRREEIAKLEEAFTRFNENRLEITSRLQPIFQAAAEGRVVVIDEMNAIPHHTLIALNDLLTKRAIDQETYQRYQNGDKTIDQIDERHKFRPVFGHSEIVVAPGFAVIATGNWKPEDGVNYVGRQTLDTAFLRRFEIVTHDYLPNPVDGVLDDEANPETERKLKEQAELYRMLCARIIEPDLTAEVPEQAFTQLESLSQVARIIQDAFSGKTIPDEFIPEAPGTQAKLKPEEVIKENVLDIGKLIQYVVDPWKNDGFRYPLEVYIFDRFITRSSARPAEMLFLYKAFQLREFFKPEEGWPSLVDVMAAAQPANQDPNQPQQVSAADLQRLRNQEIQRALEFGKRLKRVLYSDSDIRYNQESLDQIKTPETRYFAPTEVIDRVIGRAPDRSRYPDLAAALREEGQAQQAIAVNAAELEARQEVTAWKDAIEAEVISYLEKDQTDAVNEILREINAEIPPEHQEIQEVVQALKQQLDDLGNLLDQNASLEGENSIRQKQEEIKSSFDRIKELMRRR